MMSSEKKHNARAAAAVAGLSLSSIRRYCQLGRIPSEKIDGRYAIPAAGLADFLRIPRYPGSPGYGALSKR